MNTVLELSGIQESSEGIPLRVHGRVAEVDDVTSSISDAARDDVGSWQHPGSAIDPL